MNRILLFYSLIFTKKATAEDETHGMKPRRKQHRSIINDEIEDTKRCDIYKTNKNRN